LPDSKQGLFNKPVMLDPFGNDEEGDHDLDMSAVAFCLTSCDTSPSASAQLKWNQPVVSDHGRWSFDPASGKVIFDPNKNFHGTATLAYAIRDLQGNLAWSLLTVVIDPPVTPELAQTGESRSLYHIHFAVLGIVVAIGLIYQGAKKHRSTT
jgi:hypothetical protein